MSGVLARILARMSRGCYTENGPVEFKQTYTAQRTRMHAICVVRQKSVEHTKESVHSSVKRNEAKYMLHCPRVKIFAVASPVLFNSRIFVLYFRLFVCKQSSACKLLTTIIVQLSPMASGWPRENGDQVGPLQLHSQFTFSTPQLTF